MPDSSVPGLGRTSAGRGAAGTPREARGPQRGQPPPQHSLPTEPSPLPPGTTRGGSWIPIPAAPVVLEVEEVVVEVPGEGGTEARPALTPSPPGRHGSAAQSGPRNDEAAAGRGRAGPGLPERTGTGTGTLPTALRARSPQISAPQPPQKRPGSARLGSQPPPHLSTCRARDLKNPQTVDFSQQPSAVWYFCGAERTALFKMLPAPLRKQGN